MARRWQVVVAGVLVLALLAFLFVMRSEEEKGVVGDGPVAEITDERVCLQYPGPPPSNKMGTRCYNLPEEADVEDSIQEGDIVRVRSIDGKVVSVQAFPLPQENP